MMVKKSLLPAMLDVRLRDREGKDVVMSVDARTLKGRIYLFVSDTHQLGASHLAKDALYFIQQLVDRFQLDTDNTEFYRHIYQEQMGSVFGRFQVDWNGGSDPSYRFQMLTNVDDMVGITRILADGETVELDQQQLERVAV